MKEKNQTKKPQKKFENLSKGGKSINLIPNLTAEEAKVEKNKLQINTSAAIAIVVLVVFSMIVVGANILTKTTLNAKKERMYSLERSTQQRSSLLSSNEEILRRVNLYKKIEETTYSTKDVVVYWQTISQGLATIETIELTEGLNFKVGGKARNLTDVSKLWYLLGNDSHVDNVNLKNVVKDNVGARFTFEGQLDPAQFVKDRENG